MKALRLSTLLTVAAAVASGAFLFWTSQNVQQAEGELYSLQKATVNEQKTIRVLEAEWSYLNRPDRLEVLAQDYLGLSTPEAGHVTQNPTQLPDPFIPTQPQQKPEFTIEAQPAVFFSSGKRGGAH